MAQSVSIITLPMPLRLGPVNCYLLRAGAGYVLIDTGAANAREILRGELDRLGCRPGTLALILLTHGDFDHIGNAAYLRGVFGSRIAMHADEARAAEVGDMFAGRKKPNPIFKVLAPRLFGFGRSERFTPDVLLRDGAALAEYGLAARVLAIPGHSQGSIGILTDDGDFFCGDLFENTKQPALNSLIDDRDAAIQSAQRLRSLGIRTVYPGHGEPFPMDQLSQD